MGSNILPQSDALIRCTVHVTNHYCRTPQSGSFVRPDKVSFGKSAQSSIESRYGTVEDEFTVKVNQQKKILLQQTMNAPFLEMVGFDKIFNIQSNFQELRIVNLRNQNVSSAGLKLGETCPNIEELDVSKNLFVSWLDIVEMCKQLKRLHWLNVSENFLSIPELFSKQDSFPNLRTLICGSMELTWHDIVRVIPLFPAVEELRVPHNKIESITTVGGLFQHLNLLDIEGNQLGHWNEICKLAEVPHLEHLVIENIGLQSIEFEGDEGKVSILNNLRKLCISNNNLIEVYLYLCKYVMLVKGFLNFTFEVFLLSISGGNNTKLNCFIQTFYQKKESILQYSKRIFSWEYICRPQPVRYIVRKNNSLRWKLVKSAAISRRCSLLSLQNYYYFH